MCLLKEIIIPEKYLILQKVSCLLVDRFACLNHDTMVLKSITKLIYILEEKILFLFLNIDQFFPLRSLRCRNANREENT